MWSWEREEWEGRWEGERERGIVVGERGMRGREGERYSHGRERGERERSIVVGERVVGRKVGGREGRVI